MSVRSRSLLAFLATGLIATMLALASPAAAQAIPPSSYCTGETTHTIAEVQGPGDATPVVGTVAVAGVVTADHRVGGYNGAYIQTVGSGGAAHEVATGTASEGVFVYFGTNAANHPQVAMGDVVEVTGIAGEFNGLTQISTSSAAATAVCESGAELPEATPLSFPLDEGARESVEGMLVAPVGPVTVSDVYNTNRFGELVLTAGTEAARIPTDLHAPGSAEAIDLAAANRANRFLLDDARTTNLATAGLLPPYLSADEPVRVGDAVDTFGPVVWSYGFNEWRLQPTLPVDDTTPAAERTTFDVAGRPPAIEVPGDVKVATFNVLNYFVHFGGNARGAANEAALVRQEAKIVSAITALEADVVGLQEIENSVRFTSGEHAALERLVGALNDAEGEGTWAYVANSSDLPPAEQQDFITNAIIYKPGAVTPIGDARSVYDESVWFNAREPIAQAFEADDLTFTVVVNHFKSKGNSNPPQSGNDNEDVGDGQGAFNGDRTRQAAALLAFADELATEDPDGNVFLLGDFNSYGAEDPLAVLIDAGFVNVTDDAATGQDSYVFAGERGSLDHVLANPAAAAAVVGVDLWETNAHEAYAYQYDGTPAFYDDGPYRASDHNPAVVGLSADPGEPTDEIELQIVGFNDFHGRLEPVAEGPPPVGGAAQLAGLVNELRAENPNTAVVNAGDNIGASTFISAVDEDRPTLLALNEIGLDAAAVGNHEFDQGWADLRDRVLDEADFPYLGANVYEDGERALEPYVIQELGGVDVAYIGVVTEQTPSLVAPDGIATLTFTDPVAEAEAVAAELKDGDPANGEADVVVLLAHEGAAQSTTDPASLLDDPVFGGFASISADVDVVFSAHTHQEYALLVPGDDGDRAFVQAGDYGRLVGVVDLTFDPVTGEVTEQAAELLPVAGYAPDPAVQAIVDQAIADAEELGAVEIGSITADILRGYTGTPPVEDRGIESVMGNFIADVQLDQTSAPGRGGAQIALMNAGGLRTDLLYGDDGVVTYSDAFLVQPFANDVVTQTLTGAQLKQVLEEQWQPAGASRPVLWLGISEGLTYQYDPTQPQGERVIAGTLQLHGEVIDPAGEYRVTSNSFLASGGDNYFTLAEGTDRVTTGDNDLTMLRNHFEANSPVTADPEPRTSVGQAGPPPSAPFPTWEAMVERLYLDVGHRAPSPVELVVWSALLDQGVRTPEQLIMNLLNVDVSSNRSVAIRLHLGALGRPGSEAELATAGSRLGSGTSLATLAEELLAVPGSPYAGTDDSAFVELLYQRILLRDGDAGGLTHWTALLEGGQVTRGQVLAAFTESDENRNLRVLDLRSVELARAMNGEISSTVEYLVVMPVIRSGALSLEEAAGLLLRSDRYAERIGSPGQG